MTRKERCPSCNKPVVGLYKNNRKKKYDPIKQWIRLAYYCENCKSVLEDSEVVYKKITYEKKREE